VPDPISYKYSENQTTIQAGVTYKVIKNFNSDSFSISYGTTPGGDSQIYSDGEFFTGSPGQSTYSIVSGEGSVCIYSELLNLSNVEDASSYFENKILPNCQVIKTFDLRSGTKIGNYVRGIFNTLTDSYSPVNINFGNQGYTYFNGIDCWGLIHAPAACRSLPAPVSMPEVVLHAANNSSINANPIFILIL
jgi:hypothetical protein